MFRLLEDNPRLGSERRLIEPPVRVFPAASHLIVYRVRAREVVILRVRHGREDWSSNPAG